MDRRFRHGPQQRQHQRANETRKIPKRKAIQRNNLVTASAFPKIVMPVLEKYQGLRLVGVAFNATFQWTTVQYIIILFHFR